MIVRKTHLLLPLLALTLAMAASVNAQDRQYQRSQGTALSLQISVGSNPHWVGVPGTRVQAIRQGDRTDYDMFRYGRFYYAYNNHNNRWYMSRRWRGQFTLIDDRFVPRELRRIPRDHWRNYPASWEDRDYRSSGDRDYRRSDGSSGSLQLSFGTAPRWEGISGTRVEMITQADRLNYDVFRYGSTYYVYNDNRWYTSKRESGEFTMIDERSVPSELSRVPRDHWHNYPQGWQDQDGNGNGQDNSRGRSRGHN